MAHKIPKMQWKNYIFTGDTVISNPTISNIPDTTNLEVGMYVEGTGIPSGAKIISKTVTSVTLDSNATANGTGISFDFYFQISFDYPPIEKKGEKLDPKERVAVSISGVRQVTVDYIEATRSLKFEFITDTIKDAFEEFFTTHGMFGRTFRYFDDKTLTNYIEYELSTLKFEPAKDTGRTLWDFPVVMRRVL